MAGQILGANVFITLYDADHRLVEPNQIPRLYITQQFRGTDIVVDRNSISLTSESAGIFQQIVEALTPYQEIAEGLSSFVTGQPGLGGLGNIFRGFRDAISGGQSNLGGEIRKFIFRAITVDIPFPHPSGLRYITVRSTGRATHRWLLPNLSPNPDTHETIFPGVKQKAGLLYVYENAGTEMHFDLEQIAQSLFWKVFFINDYENIRFFPILYGFRDDDCAIVLAINLHFFRYDWAPEIQTGIGEIKKPIFVDPEAESVEDGYRPPNSSIITTDQQELRVIRWRDGRVSLDYDTRPTDTLSLTGKSHSVRLKYPGIGSLRNWGIEFSVESSSNLQLPIYHTYSSSLPQKPNSEGIKELTQVIPGMLLMPGSTYSFDIFVTEGDTNRKVLRSRKILRVENPALAISSNTPLIIKRGGKVVLQGEFGYYSHPDDTSPPGTRGDSMLESVTVGGQPVLWEYKGQELTVGPIPFGGPISLKFSDSSIVTSAESVKFMTDPWEDPN